MLPPHHVARPRLVGILEAAPVAVVVAGGGYGKTTLAVELGRSLGIATAIAHLGPEDGPPVAFVARLADAFRRNGLSDAAEALRPDADEPPAAIARLVAALAQGSDPILIVVDEIEHVGDDAGRLVAALARELPEGHRLVLVGRTLPPSLTGLAATPGAVQLGQLDLAFSADDAVALLAHVGVDDAAAWAARFHRLGDGWPVALALAGERLARSDDQNAELARMESSPALVSGLLEAPLESLPAEARDGVRQLAHLPHLTTEIAERATGVSWIVELATAAGVPFQLSGDGRVELPDSVREVVAAPGGLSQEVAARAADAYVAQDLGTEAIRVLVSAGAADLAAATAAALSPREVSRFDVRDLRALLATIAPEAVDRHPRAWMHLARACEASAERGLRTQLLERTAGLARGDVVLEREVDAECARDLVRDGRIEEAAALAERLLAEAGPTELQTRVRALHVLGRTYAWHGDAAGLATAEPLLQEAAELYGRLGFATAKAHALLALAYDVQTLGGRFEDAVATLEDALAALPRRSRLRGVVLTFQAEALIDLGRLRDAEASLVEAERLGEIFGDARTLGYTAWLRARAAAPLGDAARVRAQLTEAERHRGEWFEHHSGAEFLAEAAVLLDQVGDTELSDAYLGRARERATQAPRYTKLAEGAVAARRGDPTSAERILAEVAELPDLEVRERWRVALFRAWAAHRAGDAAAAGTHARDAFDLAAGTGAPDLPLRREPELAEALLPLAAGDGSAAAAEHLPGALAADIVVLGGFHVRRGGRPVELAPGLPTALVKLLAVHRGRRPADEAIEALWPGVDEPSGRKRLRNVLNRLRDTAGELVVRDGETLALAPGAEVDAAQFERAALAALAEPSSPAADDRGRAALVLYTGEALPDDRYEDWAAEPRERMRSLALSLLDLLADRAERSGELDEALRLLDRAIEVDRLDESRYVRTARLLLRQGKRGRALDALRAAAAALRELGLEPSDEHRALVRSTRA
jgi:DNA-binding SARP family transcriptional activator